MKAIILHFIIWILSLAFSQQDDLYSTKSKKWVSFFNQMKFREPIIFTPFEIKLGYVNYGGDDYWSQLPYNSSEIINKDLPIQLDSTQYKFNVINALTNRTGIIIETDLLRTNLPHYLIHQNYFDIQIGIGFQYAEFSSKTSLPSDTGTEWNISSSRGDYYFSPKSIGLNINTSLGWQFRPKRTSYIYYSFGLNKISLYESEGGDISLTGFGFSESFALGTKFILNQNNKNHRYTLGIETKWNRQYFSDLDYPEGLSPIIGIDIKSSGIFLTTGIQFGGNRTDGDLAYNDMLEQNFISAVENFEYFLAKERRHGKRKKALKMLQYCRDQIPYQQVNLAIHDINKTNYTEATNLFNVAELEANDNLKNEIEIQRQNIAFAIIDSVINNKNNLTISESEELINTVNTLMPNEKANQILADLYYEKGKLNSNIGNFYESIINYNDAKTLYPAITPIIKKEIDNLIKLLIKEAFVSTESGDLRLAIKSLETIIDLNPELEPEWDHYIQKLKLEQLNNKSINNNYAQEYIENKQIETIFDSSNILQLGMTYNEVEKIYGKPLIIDEINESNQYFQMWTYNLDSKKTYLYFKNNRLIRIDN